MSDLSSLASALPVAIPIWDQYVDFLKWMLDGIAGYVGSGGVAIIIFTIIVRTAILPVTVKSIRSMKSMQDLQPKMAELKKKHGKDKVRLQEETMALYRTYGVNPVAGCLPMLLQLPIFLGVYSAISGLSRSESGYWAGSFLWLDSLKAADPLHILPILAGVFQLVQNQMSRTAGQQGKATDPQQAMMNTMMNIFPIFSVLFGWTFISGAVLYWVAQGVYGIIQQWFMTGWGRLNDWVPNLPQLPEHKRLGYRAPRDLDAFDPDSPPAQRGLLGRWWAKQMEQAQAINKERSAKTGDAVSTASATASATATGASNGASRNGASGDGRAAQPARSARATSTAKADKPYKRDSPKGRMLAEQARRSAGDALTVDEEVATATPNGAHPARRRPRRAR